jgi:hypothetical protein
MGEPSILLPVRCPLCGTVERVAFPVIVVITAMTAWKQMRLFAACHEVSWDASVAEIQSIREHLGDSWFPIRATALVRKSEDRLAACSLAHKSGVVASVVGVAAAADSFQPGAIEYGQAPAAVFDQALRLQGRSGGGYANAAHS